MPDAQRLDTEMIELDSNGRRASQNIETDNATLQWTRSEQSSWARRYEELEQWVELGQYHVQTLRRKVQNLEKKNAELQEENTRLRQTLRRGQ